MLHNSFLSASYNKAGNDTISVFFYFVDKGLSANDWLALQSTCVAVSGQSKGERGGTAFPHLLFLVYTVPPSEFEGYALAS